MMNFQQPQPVAGRGQMRSFAPAPATTTPAIPGQQQPKTPAAPSFSQQDLDRSRTQAQRFFTGAQQRLGLTQGNITASLRAEEQAERRRQEAIAMALNPPVRNDQSVPGSFFQPRQSDLDQIGQRAYDAYLSEQRYYMPRSERDYRLAEAQKELETREAALGTVESDYYRDLERRQAQYYEGGMGRGGQTYGQDLGTFYG